MAGLDIAHGNHASELLEPRSMQSSETVRAYTDFAWKTPVSPHLAVKIEGWNKLTSFKMSKLHLTISY